MKQVLQSYRTGQLRVVDVPAPGIRPRCVLVQTHASLLSIGTDRLMLNLARSSLLGKARERPDLVRKVVARVARDGLVATGRAVLDKLDQAVPLGYSCCGTVIAVGDGVPEFSVGDRVACAGAKEANHAEVNLVSRNLCVPVPLGVPDEAAAFVTLGAIALQGVRAVQPTLGETFAVIGLGLVGQLTSQLLRANGCRVLAIDLNADKVALAQRLGADRAIEREGPVLQASLDLTSGRGVDGVIITASAKTNDPIVLAGDLCRDRARVSVVGAVSTDIPRRPYYDKEIEVIQSRSYGPGRYDPNYEDLGVDYPIGYVRWTERRNLEAFLDLCNKKAIDVASLISHRFDITAGEEAYATMEREPDALGIILTYPHQQSAPARTVSVARRTIGSLNRVGFVGAGAFASGTLIPAAAAAGAELVTIASARGITARHLADRFHFRECSTDTDRVLAHPDIDAVFIATRHHLHAPQAEVALRASKHVFVEKPLALSLAELEAVLAAQEASGHVLFVGYNRRFSPLAAALKGFFAERRSPLVIYYRVNAGQIPADSWIHDPAVGGGRILGEVCHFIDLACYLAGAMPISVHAEGIQARGAARADDNLVLTLKLGDGSVCSILYAATGDPSGGKERVEVLGDDAIGCLDDFRSLHLHRGGRGRTIRKLSQDKGHRAAVRAFFEAIRVGASAMSMEQIAAVSRATFGAVESLHTGETIKLS
jgi:predicted dehydrogenase/threonine dehydrogenase-like Zn-dependent dehydrogenase